MCTPIYEHIRNIRKPFFSLIAVSIQAIDDVWLIGDQLLKNSYTEFQNLRSTECRRTPFMFRFYNVFCFYTSLLKARYNGLIRLQESLIDAFNRCIYLPKFIIVLPDVAILETINLDKCSTDLLFFVFDLDAESLEDQRHGF